MKFSSIAKYCAVVKTDIQAEAEDEELAVPLTWSGTNYFLSLFFFFEISYVMPFG